MEFSDWFQILISIIMTLSLFLLKGFKSTLSELNASVNGLNKNIAIIFERDKHNAEKIAENKAYNDRNYVEIRRVADKLHEVINQYISKIDKNENNIENIRNELNKLR